MDASEQVKPADEGRRSSEELGVEPPKRCAYCRCRTEPWPETIGADYSQWTEREFARGWRFDAATNTKTYHCMAAFYEGS